jgi:hypothetical protein
MMVPTPLAFPFHRIISYLGRDPHYAVIKRSPLVLSLFFLFTITSGGNCKKSNSPTNRLPPETHEGLNTMGCTVNGSLFIPQEPLLNPQGYYFARYTNLDLRLAWQISRTAGLLR